MRKEQCQWSSPAGWTPKPPGALGSSAQLLLVFGDAATATGADCLESLGNLYPNAQLFGCSSAGEIQGTTLSDGTLVTTAIAFDHTRVAAGRAPVQGCAGGFEAGVQAVSSLPKEGLRHVLVLAPGNYMNGGDLVRGINSVLPACVTASGGFAGAGGSVHGSSVWCGGPPERSAVVVLGLYGARLKVGTGSGGGWRPFGPDRRITRSFKETIYEFDRRPALELYKQYLGEYAQGLPFTALRFPLGLRTCESEPWQVRVINGIDEPNGGLAFDCSIPEGAHARFLVGNAEHLVEGARAAAQLVRQELGVPAQLSIVVSCYGRRVVLGQRTEEELETVRDALDGRTVLTGFYSYGEISRHAAGTQAELYNQTMTLTGFAEV
jgi:hypothetical protein